MKIAEEIKQEFVNATGNNVLDEGDYSEWLESKLIWMTAERNRLRNNENHSLDLRKKLDYETERRKAAEEYLRCINDSGEHNRKEFDKAFSHLSMLISEESEIYGKETP